MRHVSLVVHVTGVIVRMFGVMFLAPLAVALLYGEHPGRVGLSLSPVVTVGNRAT